MNTKRTECEAIERESSTHLNYIGLCGQAFQVRNLDGIRQILCNGTWVNTSTFVDAMAQEKQWDVLCELANAAQLLRPDEVEKLLGQKTGF